VKEPAIYALPTKLEQLIEYRWPDALWITHERHSSEAYTLNVLDLDYSYTVWRACLSLDHRWTLSPVAGPWQATEARMDT
jgi:hypothetical protein